MIMVGYMHEVFPGFGLILQLGLFLIFLFVVFWVVKSGNISNESAEDIAKKRFAKGEISKKELNEIFNELKK